nr:MAG TPA: hypothetical protein [Caudoviricetes sp.]
MSRWNCHSIKKSLSPNSSNYPFCIESVAIW